MRHLPLLALLILGLLTLPARSAAWVVWPNATSSANSDPWLMAHHDDIDEIRPRFLVVNFANGLGEGGEDNVKGGPLSVDQVRQKAQRFLDMLSAASTWQPRLHPGARPFLRPELVRVVNLQDHNGHANSNLFPRGPADPKTGYPEVGYARLFSAQYAPSWGFSDHGRPLTLGELVDRGLVNEVIMMANQVDGRPPNPPGQVTNHILEVAMVAQAYDSDFHKLPGQYVKNGIAHDRQRVPSDQCTWHDDNSMPWVGRSLRVYFMNASRGPGCLLHSLGHEFEFRYNEASVYAPGTPADGRPVNPWLQPLFRLYADFDLKARYHVPFDSLYAGGDHYSYPGGSLVYKGGQIPQYVAGAGNVHYPPGATHGYDYHPAATVLSTIETFCKPGGRPEPWNPTRFGYLTRNGAIDQDCGGDFLVYWFQNMPGRHNDCIDFQGRPMRNWWPFMYY